MGKIPLFFKGRIQSYLNWSPGGLIGAEVGEYIIGNGLFNIQWASCLSRLTKSHNFILSLLIS